jgi:hypothetical protein
MRADADDRLANFADSWLKLAMVSPKPKPNKSARAALAAGKQPIKLHGNPQSRRVLKDATKRVLAYCSDVQPTAGAKRLGVGVDDLRTMRAGYQLTLPVLLKMVRVGGYDPISIIKGPTIRKLPAKRDTRGAQPRLVYLRMRKLAWSQGGLEWARKTGLSIVGVYGLRYGGLSKVKLVTILAFCEVGPSLEEILFGD